MSPAAICKCYPSLTERVKQPRVKCCLLDLPKHYRIKRVCSGISCSFCLHLCVFTASISAYQSFCQALLTTQVKWWWIVKPLVHRVGYPIPCGESWPRLCSYLRSQQYAQRNKEDFRKSGWSQQNYEEELLLPPLYSHWKKPEMFLTGTVDINKRLISLKVHWELCRTTGLQMKSGGIFIMQPQSSCRQELTGSEEEGSACNEYILTFWSRILHDFLLAFLSKRKSHLMQLLTA